jgi:hypothetical protein
MRLVRNWGRCHRAMQALLRKLSRSVLTAWTRSSPMYMGPSLGVGGRLCPSCSSNRWPACARRFLYCRTFLYSSATVIYVQITGDCQLPALDLNFLVVCSLQFQGNRKWVPAAVECASAVRRPSHRGQTAGQQVQREQRPCAPRMTGLLLVRDRDGTLLWYPFDRAELPSHPPLTPWPTLHAPSGTPRS